MFIDDDEIYNFLMEKKVSDAFSSGVESIFFSSGQDALDYLEAKVEWPDIIFLDVKMPEMTGFDFLEAYQKRNFDTTHNTAIYMLSSSLNKKDIEMSKAYQPVVRFINKPLEIEELKSILAQHHSG